MLLHGIGGALRHVSAVLLILLQMVGHGVLQVFGHGLLDVRRQISAHIVRDLFLTGRTERITSAEHEYN